jgi:cytidylate kinase
MVRAQRQIAEAHPRLVTEGRDQGSVVFPDAQVKIYLTASAEIRAARRAEQLRAAGQSADIDRLLADIVERDRSDASRHDGPLTCPEGAHRVDTSELRFDEVVDELERIVREGIAMMGSDAAKKNEPLGALV